MTENELQNKKWRKNETRYSQDFKNLSQKKYVVYYNARHYLGQSMVGSKPVKHPDNSRKDVFFHLIHPVIWFLYLSYFMCFFWKPLNRVWRYYLLFKINFYFLLLSPNFMLEDFKNIRVNLTKVHFLKPTLSIKQTKQPNKYLHSHSQQNPTLYSSMIHFILNSL